MACTEAVHARNNTATNFTNADKGVPIYWLGGDKAADDYEDFYDGAWDDEINDKDESGANGPDTSQAANHPWTGCAGDGTQAFNSELSATLGNATGYIRTGLPNSNSNSNSVNTGPISGPYNPASTDNRPVYGLSAVFTVTEGTPEETAVLGTPILDTSALVPTELTAGDQFRLIFLSSTKRNASSSSIGTYNTFIQDRAAVGHGDIQAHSDGFTAVGCTAAVDARDNTGTSYTSVNKGVPIYWLGGTRVADDYEDFYDGSWNDEEKSKDESGANGPDISQTANHPWTGCADNGSEGFNSHISVALGNPTGFVRTGLPDGNNVNTGPISGPYNPASTETRPLYGLSAVFTVADLSDATLSILSLAQDGPITLTPAFDPATTGYTAEVANTVETISLTALQNHDGATVSVMDSDGNSIPDTAQIDLGYGENIISIVVTAQNGTTKVTYQVTVTRGFAWNSTMTVGERLTGHPPSVRLHHLGRKHG